MSRLSNSRACSADPASLTSQPSLLKTSATLLRIRSSSSTTSAFIVFERESLLIYYLIGAIVKVVTTHDAVPKVNRSSKHRGVEIRADCLTAIDVNAMP